MLTQPIDLLIIGGGINGAGIAADAAGRGLSVVLCEKDDLANHTSSSSSKLIHGGLRYLEQFEFKLVREALKEREILLRIAPHLVHPMEFVLPYDDHLRPAWMIRAGLWLYDSLSKRVQLAASHKVNFAEDSRGDPLRDQFTLGFSYMDCQTDDARMVVSLAQLAQQKGAEVLTHTKVSKAQRQGEFWQVTLIDQESKARTIKAKAIVNASGAWVSDVLSHVAGISSPSRVKLIKGSHFTVPKFYQGNQAYILQNPDKRVIFAIPYRQHFTLIGTTDIVYQDDPQKLTATQIEIDYLLKSLQYYFKNSPSADDINWSYAGVRALYNDDANNPSKITREYHLEVNDEVAKCPILSVFGGKITTYRALAERAMRMLKPYFPEMGRDWTAYAYYPGGDFSGLNFNDFLSNSIKQHSNLPPALIERYAKNYGANMSSIIGTAKKTSQLGQCFGADLFAAEVQYLVEHEWVQSAEDILWRRSKLGLVLSAQEQLALTAMLN